MSSEDVSEMVVGLRCSDICLRLVIHLPFFDRIWVCEPELLAVGESFVELPRELDLVFPLGRALYECVVATGLTNACLLDANMRTIHVELIENSSILLDRKMYPLEDPVILLDDVMTIVRAVQDFAAKIPQQEEAKEQA